MLRLISGVLDVSLRRCWKASPCSRGKTVRHWAIFTFALRSTLCADVNQFSIITELLGTPPDDVIATIASENVRVDWNVMRLTSLLIASLDFAFCQKFAEARETALQVEIEVQ